MNDDAIAGVLATVTIAAIIVMVCSSIGFAFGKTNSDTYKEMYMNCIRAASPIDYATEEDY